MRPEQNIIYEELQRIKEELKRIEQLTDSEFSSLDFNAPILSDSKNKASIFWHALFEALNDNSVLLRRVLSLHNNKVLEDFLKNEDSNILLRSACELALRQEPALLNRILALPESGFNSLDFNAKSEDGKSTIFSYACDLALNEQPELLDRILTFPEKVFNCFNFYFYKEYKKKFLKDREFMLIGVSGDLKDAGVERPMHEYLIFIKAWEIAHYFDNFIILKRMLSHPKKIFKNLDYYISNLFGFFLFKEDCELLKLKDFININETRGKDFQHMIDILIIIRSLYNNISTDSEISSYLSIFIKTLNKIDDLAIAACLSYGAFAVMLYERNRIYPYLLKNVTEDSKDFFKFWFKPCLKIGVPEERIYERACFYYLCVPNGTKEEKRDKKIFNLTKAIESIAYLYEKKYHFKKTLDTLDKSILVLDGLKLFKDIVQAYYCLLNNRVDPKFESLLSANKNIFQQITTALMSGNPHDALMYWIKTQRSNPLINLRKKTYIRANEKSEWTNEIKKCQSEKNNYKPNEKHYSDDKYKNDIIQNGQLNFDLIKYVLLNEIQEHNPLSGMLFIYNLSDEQLDQISKHFNEMNSRFLKLGTKILVQHFENCAFIIKILIQIKSLKKINKQNRENYVKNIIQNLNNFKNIKIKDRLYYVLECILTEEYNIFIPELLLWISSNSPELYSKARFDLANYYYTLQVNANNDSKLTIRLSNLEKSIRHVLNAYKHGDQYIRESSLMLFKQLLFTYCLTDSSNVCNTPHNYILKEDAILKEIIEAFKTESLSDVLVHWITSLVHDPFLKLNTDLSQKILFSKRRANSVNLPKTTKQDARSRSFSV